jgi:Raf kinase inhibitor-like YbhB/YbcL family protein
MKAFILTTAALLCASLLRAAPETNMQLTSGDFSEGGNIPSRFTCDDANVNPSLRIAGAPANTKSFALLLLDPDAPRGTFTHWVVWNIALETKEFTAGTVPNGVEQGVNDFGKPGYGGPCPPSGIHRYIFQLYALDFVPRLAASSRSADLERSIKGHILAKATLTGRYGREPAAR